MAQSKKHAVIQAGNAGLTYSYDANGNATARFGHAITWTSYNYPSTIYGADKTLEFQYGPDRQRFKQIYTSGAGVETTMYVGDLLEKVTSGGITAWRHYVKAGGQTIAVINRLSTGTNSTRYVLEDHQGSYDQILDAAGATYVSESFSAFGARRDPNAWTNDCLCDDLSKIKNFSRRGYTGHEAIGGVSMGLNHMNGRVQDAMSGRFLSPDPYVPSPELTQSFNRFSYVLNNPLSFTDPTGFMEEVTVTGYRDSGMDLPYAFGFDAGNSWSFVGLFRTDGWTAADTPPPEVMEEVTVVGKTPPTSGKPPCTGIAEAIQDFTGGDSSRSFVDDVVNNFVDTKDSAASSALELASSLAGGGTAAAGYYGTTPLKVVCLAIVGYNEAVRSPGLLGSATPLQLFGTAAATWAVNSVLIKGTYNAGVLVGSIARTAANRAGTAACSK